MDEIANGNVWVVAENRLFFVNASTKNIIQHIENAGPIFRVKVQGNTIQAGAKYTGLWKHDGSNWTHFIKTDGLVSDTINDFDVSPVGHVWVATRKGISQYNGTAFLTHNPFSVRDVTAICAFGGVIYAGNSSAAEAIKRLDQNVWIDLPLLPGIFLANPETTLSGGLKIYTNPSNGIFIISQPNCKAETAQAVVYNNLGQQVATIGLLKEVNGILQLQQSGFYQFVITENDKIVATEKLVVKQMRVILNQR